MRFAALLAVVCLCAPAYGRTKHKAANSKAHHSTASAGRHSSSKTAHGRRSRAQAHRSSAPYQGAPTPERYEEIQQALADRGYYKGSVNGTWGPDSAEALRRFQTDQKIGGDGKLTSKSLILMGLGSKHAPVAKATPPENSPAQGTPAGSTPNDHRSPEGSQRP